MTAFLITTVMVAGAAESMATLRALRDAQAAYARQDYALAVWNYDRAALVLRARPQLRQARAEALSLSVGQRTWLEGELRLADGDWLGAVEFLSQLSPDDPHAAAAHGLIDEALAYRQSDLTARAALQARDDRAWREEERARVRAAALRALVQTLESERAGAPGRVGIYFRDLRDGTTIDLGGDQEYVAASVYKLAVLAAVYHAESLGQLALTDQIAFQQGDYEDGYYEDYTSGEVFTVEQLVDRMIQESDNTSARMLARTLSWGQVEQYAHSLGATHALIATDNQMTPEDAGALLAAIYSGQVAPAADTQAMLALLESTVYHDGWIPAGVPQATVAHKVGFYGSSINDAALIFAPGHPFVLVIFTDSMGAAAPALLQTVAAQVYAFVIAPVTP
jgi:beta-lactamase class A